MVSLLTLLQLRIGVLQDPVTSLLGVDTGTTQLTSDHTQQHPEETQAYIFQPTEVSVAVLLLPISTLCSTILISSFCKIKLILIP